MLIIYQPKIFPKERFLRFVKKLREAAKENGFDDVYLLAIRKIGINREVLEELDLNGAVEFYPCDLPPQLKKKKEKIINKEAVVTSWDIGKYIREKGYMDNPDFNLFKGCFTNWDSTARKCYSNAMIFQTTPEQYKTWLKDIVNWSYKNNGSDHNYIFINAWNEWAEGAHLEPDQKYGYAYLNATEEAIVEGTREATAMKRAAASIEKNIRNVRLLQEMEERRKQKDMAETKASIEVRKKFYGKPAAAKPTKRTRRPKEGGDGESK